MWVRGQDKETLVKCENVCIAYDNGSYDIRAFVEEYNYFKLGSYSTKEKAINVMDLLQKYIGGKQQYYIVKDNMNSNKAYKVSNNIYTPMYYCVNGVFQMPADDKI